MNGEDIKFVFGAALTILLGWTGYEHTRVDNLQKQTSKQEATLCGQKEKVEGMHDLLTEVRDDVKTILRNGGD